ncbi:hypothetical protein [Phenylobacterium sp.]|jgi:hypothetical protein|uniref:hypothetical protein n=1 Tax=Phenylobacterium sp. TaxID=1871053 RepID=UPI002E373C46|nr:hypothetical protein [Phenylobacterium sp.]HEX3365050.1 hypothetical protein [Phenylobacterium sp.]
MEKLFAGAAAAAVLSVAVPAWAVAPDGVQSPQAFGPPAETVTARAHLVFTNAIDPPVVGDVTVIQESAGFAVVKTSFTTASPLQSAPSAVVPCPPAKAGTSTKTKG